MPFQSHFELPHQDASLTMNNNYIFLSVLCLKHERGSSKHDDVFMISHSSLSGQDLNSILPWMGFYKFCFYHLGWNMFFKWFFTTFRKKKLIAGVAAIFGNI